ncbi:MAG TPA: CrcB family protein [Myxococcota bacterium]|nr:CrcB family protein [Myxococcota bacterium]
MKDALLVAIGGGAGAALRWWLFATWPGPWSILIINVVGSALLAWMSHPGWALAPEVRLLVGTGLLGGFTTYSTFNLDVLTAVRLGAWGRAAAVLGLTVVGCLVGGSAGWWLADRATR